MPIKTTFISCNYFVNNRKEIPMTTTVLRKKVIEYVNQLEAVYKTLLHIESEDNRAFNKLRLTSPKNKI